MGAKHPVTDAQLASLRAGVVLDDDPLPVRAAAAERTGEHTLRMTLTEGKYHQVTRLIAAAGNRVETLHRSRFGPWTLPDSLAPGQWASGPGWMLRRPPPMRASCVVDGKPIHLQGHLRQPKGKPRVD